MNGFSRLSVSIMFCLSGQQASANVLQLFLDSTFINPASMTMTKSNHLGVGATVTNPFYQFAGSIGPVYNTIESVNKNTFLLPDAQLYHRLSESTVIGLDVSHPVFGNVNWPANGFQNFLGVDAITMGYEVAPKISHNLTPSLAIGASFRYDVIYRSEVNFNIPGVGLELNRGNITPAVSGALGFWYKINDTTFLDGSYFSPVGKRASGQSVAGPFVNNNFAFHYFQLLPNTFFLNLVHIFNEKFLASVKVSYSIWKPDRNLILENTAAGSNPTVLPTNLNNTFAASLFGRYKTGSSTALLALFGYDQSAVNQYTNIVAFPVGNVYTAAVGAEYNFNKSTAFKFLVGQARVSNNINNPLGFAVGRYKARYTFGDLGFTIDF